VWLSLLKYISDRHGVTWMTYSTPQPYAFNHLTDSLRTHILPTITCISSSYRFVKSSHSTPQPYAFNHLTGSLRTHIPPHNHMHFIILQVRRELVFHPTIICIQSSYRFAKNSYSTPQSYAFHHLTGSLRTRIPPHNHMHSIILQVR
jgi:hypothetical protein